MNVVAFYNSCNGTGVVVDQETSRAAQALPGHLAIAYYLRHLAGRTSTPLCEGYDAEATIDRLFGEPEIIACTALAKAQDHHYC